MTLTMTHARPVTMRLLGSDADWWTVRDLIVRTHSITPVGWNWDVL